jgi:hypothetical protein
MIVIANIFIVSWIRRRKNTAKCNFKGLSYSEGILQLIKCNKFRVMRDFTKSIGLYVNGYLYYKFLYMVFIYGPEGLKHAACLCSTHVLDGPIDYVLTVKVQREVKRQTVLASSSITIHDTAPMYFTSSFVNNIPFCWSSAHIYRACCCHRIQHKMDNIKQITFISVCNKYI